MYSDSIEVVSGDSPVTDWVLVLSFPRMRQADNEKCTKERYLFFFFFFKSQD